ncbi:recombinase family protein [Nocardia nova]|uniref:recombinase family protein n=1 Tax=Nocardia nova TaxID=37330 RepID=UPI0033CC3E70
MHDDPSEWKMLDDLLGIQVQDDEFDPDRRFGFVGRCSTEDNQDPKTSRDWQLSNATALAPGRIVEIYFDTGQSRSVPWDRRPNASRLLSDLKNPHRGWTAIVVGEGQRCWFGNQFSLIAPRLEAYGVGIWIPELGGAYESSNTAHNMMMSMLGGMSQSERQHVQQRTRAAMDAQVLNEGRHQGGRAPYGYRTIDGQPHPNPSRAAQGLRLRLLSIDESAAAVVRRIFRDYIAGAGASAIAAALNREGIPCPSAHRPEQNTHRSGAGWQASTVAAILQNPRYTGYAVFGRWFKKDELLDPDDVAAGYVSRVRRSNADRVVRSKRPAHPKIVSVATFTEAHLIRRARASTDHRVRVRAGGNLLANMPREYVLRGRIRCVYCDRRMQAGMLHGAVYYRCAARTLAPGSVVRDEHPPTVNLRESHIVGPLNRWLAGLFNAQNRRETLAMLLQAVNADDGEARRKQLKQKTTDAELKLRRHRAAIEAGVDPATLVAAMNSAQADKAVAIAELERLPVRVAVSLTEIAAVIDALGDIDAVLNAGAPAARADLYAALGVAIRYPRGDRVAETTASPCGIGTGVWNAAPVLSTRIDLTRNGWA